MKDRWLACLLGAWLMGSVMLFVVAPTNFRLIDELLGGSPNASFRGLVERYGHAPVRELLRYLASELNRSFFLRWNVLQLVFGVVCCVLAWRLPAGRRVRVMLSSATLLVVVLLGGFTPLIISIGRSLDFVPRDPAPPQLGRFQLLHVAYTSIELVKVVCVGLAAFWLLRQPVARGAQPAA
ncbi:MAG TPA: hypothetical protein VMG12_10270 [Polyangiaceae bacterium]|nr:hypothetical protein [Polyangiaceae bacterium]